MKTRIGFVSNSSSSSFICPLCDADYSVMDGDPKGHFSLCTCENNHSFCKKHIAATEVELLEYMRKHVQKSEIYDVENIDSFGIKKLEKLFKMDQYGKFTDERLFSNGHNFNLNFYSSIPADICPICTFQIIPQSDINCYILKKFKKRDEIIEEIRKKFKTYKDFKNFLKEENKETEIDEQWNKISKLSREHWAKENPYNEN